MLAIALRLLSLMLLAIALHSSSLLLATDLRSVDAIVFTLTHGNICFSNMSYDTRYTSDRPKPEPKSRSPSPFSSAARDQVR